VNKEAPEDDEDEDEVEDEDEDEDEEEAGNLRGVVNLFCEAIKLRRVGVA